jgi:hypothetical protein
VSFERATKRKPDISSCSWVLDILDNINLIAIPPCSLILIIFQNVKTWKRCYHICYTLWQPINRRVKNIWLLKFKWVLFLFQQYLIWIFESWQSSFYFTFYFTKSNTQASNNLSNADKWEKDINIDTLASIILHKMTFKNEMSSNSNNNYNNSKTKYKKSQEKLESGGTE